MPTYDYECGSCEHTFELFQSISEPVKKKCPSCGRRSLRRLFGTGAALLFKGSGFYQTDYRSESYQKAAAAEKKSQDTSSADGKGSDSGSGKSGKGGKSKAKATA
jgi:putative FmdB family regulatory protein